MKLASAIAIAFALFTSACIAGWTALIIAGLPERADAIRQVGVGIGVMLALACFFAWILED